MSLRLEMLQVARLAPTLLQEGREAVAKFLREQLTENGGARNLAGEPDLYYTVFVLEGLVALQEEPPVERVAPFLRSFGDGESLDLVHLACLARSWSALPETTRDAATMAGILRRVQSHRSADGGFGEEPGAERSSLYACFLGLGASQDLGAPPDQPEGIADFIEGLHLGDGSFAGGPSVPVGTTPTTAAAVELLRHLGRPAPAASGEWMLAQCGSEGGFKAIPDAPIPDLLSTAVALHALVGQHVPIDHVKDRCLDFIDSLWTGKAFCGTWADENADSEYTWYGLLALGHLSL